MKERLNRLVIRVATILTDHFRKRGSRLSSPADYWSQVCLLGLGQNCDTNQALEDWNWPPCVRGMWLLLPTPDWVINDRWSKCVIWSYEAPPALCESGSDVITNYYKQVHRLWQSIIISSQMTILAQLWTLGCYRRFIEGWVVVYVEVVIYSEVGHVSLPSGLVDAAKRYSSRHLGPYSQRGSESEYRSRIRSPLSI